MTGEMLQAARRLKGWTQARTAKALGVSQGYVALLEQGARQPSQALLRRLARLLDLPATVAPLSAGPAPGDADALAQDLANLGYPGYRHLKGTRARTNPAAVLFAALSEARLEPRSAEALPWLVMTFADLDWEWLVSRAKQHDLQNKLGFVVYLARQAAEKAVSPVVERLQALESRLERSRLVHEDVFGRTNVTEAEKRWLRANRPEGARHWNVLSSLSVEHLSYAG